MHCRLLGHQAARQHARRRRPHMRARARLPPRPLSCHRLDRPVGRQLTRRLRPHMRARARVRAVRTTISASRTLLR